MECRPQAKLGFPATVAQMTHEIVAADRADAAVKISLEGMTAGYMVQLTEITSAMVQAGFYSDASEIAKARVLGLGSGLWSGSGSGCGLGFGLRRCRRPKPDLLLPAWDGVVGMSTMGDWVQRSILTGTKSRDFAC